MKAYILGTGRSGTTALYVLLQEIFSRHCRRRPHFFYEPFLRNVHFLDDRYELMAARMNLQASISVAAMYQHLQLPLFISDPAPFLTNSYLQAIFHPLDRRPDVLIKFIRANGRFLLLRTIAPQAKAIFIIRNPADIVNSLRGRFSLFGTDFHDDDFPRFAAGLALIYGVNLPTNPAPSDVEKDLLFWYYMNRFALESFLTLPVGKRPLLLCHDELRFIPTSLVKKICDFLDVPFEADFVQAAKTRVGPVSREFILAESEQELVRSYMEKYTQLLVRHGITALESPEEIFRRFRIVKDPSRCPKRFPGLHARALEREYESLLARLESSSKAAKPGSHRRKNG